MTDTIFLDYYSLSLNDISENWISSFKHEINNDKIVDFFQLLSNELYCLFEQPLMEQNKNRVPFQLNILHFLQNNRIEKVVKNSSPTFSQNLQYLLLLFIFLSKKVVHNWLPNLIQRHKNKMSQTVLCLSNGSHHYVDDEVTKLMGLFAAVKKCEKTANKQ